MAYQCMCNHASKSAKEAEAKICQATPGDDISKDVLTGRGMTTLTTDHIMELFGKIRLRFALTPQCNLRCFFCSNEGLSYDTKKGMPARVELILALSEMLLKHTPLRSIDFSGGEPTLHPDIVGGTYQLVKWTRMYPEVKFSFHTNGVLLTPDLVDQIAPNFARIGVSVHSTFYETWNRMTNGGQIPDSVQWGNWAQLNSNLEYLSRKGIGSKVFLKSVVTRGLNDSEAELKAFLDACARYGFHPKFLQFEPQSDCQIHLRVGRKELFEKLERVDCRFPPDAPWHNDPNTYIPATSFTYSGARGAERGMHIILECGTPATCGCCYSFLCFFTKPTDNGTGLYLKPCSVHDTRFDLTQAIKTNDIEQVVEVFKASREYLMTRPGLGVSSWGRKLS